MALPPHRRARVSCFAVLLVATVLGPSCGGVPEVEPDPDALLQTSELHYTLERLDFGYATTIPYEFRNRTGATVYLRNCGGDVRPLLQVRRSGRWVDAWHPFTESCEDMPIVVRPGRTFVDTLRVVGAPPGSNVTPAFVFEDVEGIYRLLWFQAVRMYDPDRPDRSELLPLEQRISNAFALTS